MSLRSPQDCGGTTYICGDLVPLSEIEGINGIGSTTDSWTSLATENCITYTTHYITEDWEMKNRVLFTHCSEERHTAQNLALDMKEIEQKWAMNKLLFNPTFVCDNASNVTKAPRLMENPRLDMAVWLTQLILQLTQQLQLIELQIY